MNRTNPIYWLVCITYAVIACGCHRTSLKQDRADYASTVTQDLTESTKTILEGYPAPLTVDQCIEIALNNGLEARRAALKERIAKLDKHTSFGNFLPTVTLDMQKTWFDPMPQINFGGTGIAMHDKDVREVSWNIQMNLFNPATWFLYHMNSLGYDMAKLSTQYTRQAITFQVTSLYYQCLTMERMLDTLEMQVKAARATDKEMADLQKEGIVPAWQAQSAHVTVLIRQVEARRMKRALTEAYADLLVSMGLSPQATLTLQGDLPLVATDRPLEDLITDALLHHPSLGIAQAQVQLEKEKLKLAVAAFLPNLIGFAGRLDTSDSHQVNSNYWTGGLAGTLTVFNGFANVNQYKAAKVKQKDVFIQREQAALALMTQVIRAYNQIQTAREQIEVAQGMEAATQRHWQEVKNQYDLGMVQGSDLLAMNTQYDKTCMQTLQSQFQYQVSMALLNQVLGQDANEDIQDEPNE